MTDDQRARLNEKRARLNEKLWTNRAATLRRRTAEIIAQALGRSPAEIEFADYHATNRLRETMLASVPPAPSVEVADRQAALRLVQGELSGKSGTAFIMNFGMNVNKDCGAVRTDLADAIRCLDALLEAGNEYIALMLENGEAGVIISTQEGAEPYWPRYVKLWKK